MPNSAENIQASFTQLFEAANNMQPSPQPLRLSGTREQAKKVKTTRIVDVAGRKRRVFR